MGRIDYDRDEEAAAAFDREASAAPEIGAPTMILQTIDEGDYPTDAERVYACVPMYPHAEPEEGAVLLGATGEGVVYAANLGKNVPEIGTNVIAVRDGGAWVFVH